MASQIKDTVLNTLVSELESFLPEGRLIRDPLSRAAVGADASAYRLVPALVVDVLSEDEMSRTLRCCARHGVSVTFRAGGTSLSGQGVTDSVLVRLSRGWRHAEVLDGGTRIRLQPGVIGSTANRLLAPYGRKLGPDPASLDSAMIGGMVANNASGMCCGVSRNCYHTLEAMRIIFPDGNSLDTGIAADRAGFAVSHAPLVEGLSALSRRVRADTALAGSIRRKYRIKNTTGYGLNALLDYSDPIDILQHLLIGSEGTLGFVASITLRTIPDPPHKGALLAFYSDAHRACEAVRSLDPLMVEAAEFFDEASLRSVAHLPAMARFCAPADSHTLPGPIALLLDLRGQSREELSNRILTARDCLNGIGHASALFGSADDSEFAALWSLRKGLFPSIAARRPAGTTVLIEDVAFPLERLPEALGDLSGLLAEHGYGGSAIFGHAMAGNLHFVLTPNFGESGEVERYGRFMQALTELVAGKFEGSLKAEHGTGRNMAPFLAKEWGESGLEVMREIKRLFDPSGLLNPGVILNPDPRAHLQHLKPLPLAHPIVDACMECGYCEPACPSKDLTWTPRQRIVAHREMQRMRFAGEHISSEAQRAFAYAGEQTCATDGLCGTRCPVGIDTGSLVKNLRNSSRQPWERLVARMVAANFSPLLSATRVALQFATWLPWLPARFRPLPRPGRSPQPQNTAPPNGSGKRAVYFSSCIHRILGPALPGDPFLDEVLSDLCDRAGMELVHPEKPDSLCCGLAFASKGFPEAAESKSAELRKAVDTAGGSSLPVVCDNSPCSHHLKQAGFPVMDVIEFAEAYLMPPKGSALRTGEVEIFPVCSVQHQGLSGGLERLAKACSTKVNRPSAPQCCGFAGDKGFSHPELTASALADAGDKLALGKSALADGYSTSRTCEIGLSRATGKPWRSILYLLAEKTPSAP